MRNDLVIARMIEIIEKLNDYVHGCDYESFSSNSMLVEACVFNLGQLGETANKIDESYEEAHSEIPWRQIYGLRNRIVHDYEGVNLKLIWEVITDDLPDLLHKLERLR